jgi:rRNA-processing protein FCF1
MTSIPKISAQLYETDFVAWTEQTVQLIRDEQFGQVDWDAVIEEIESLGRSDRRELKSRLEVLLQHLLKWEYQSSLQSGSWRNTIDEQRNRITDLLQESPSLKSYPEEVLTQCYHRELKAASNETELAIDVFPVECPYSVAQVLDAEFLPLNSN